MLSSVAGGFLTPKVPLRDGLERVLSCRRFSIPRANVWCRTTAPEGRCRLYQLSSISNNLVKYIHLFDPHQGQSSPKHHDSTE